jgi:hypothetical protein
MESEANSGGRWTCGRRSHESARKRSANPARGEAQGRNDPPDRMTSHVGTVGRKRTVGGNEAQKPDWRSLIVRSLFSHLSQDSVGRYLDSNRRGGEPVNDTWARRHGNIRATRFREQTCEGKNPTSAVGSKRIPTKPRKSARVAEHRSQKDTDA